MIKDKTIIIAGGNSTLAQEFVNKAIKLKAKVISLGRTDPKNGSSFFKCDLFKYEELSECCKKISSDFNSFDIAINFVGTHHYQMNILNDDITKMRNEFQRVMKVNTETAFLQTAVFSREMKKTGNKDGGHIIHICSNASNLSLYGSYGYNSSMHAKVGIIKSAATQLAPHNIRVNGLAPGTIISKLNQNLLFDKNGKLTPRSRSILAHTPTKRFATSEGFSESLLAMCLNQRHLTGNVIFCDDGYNVEGHSWPDGNLKVYGDI